ncbi:hypothetical protein JXQ70_19255, partial [bacterium]|nr:hypothetical protein [bacterium]
TCFASLETPGGLLCAIIQKIKTETSHIAQLDLFLQANAQPGTIVRVTPSLDMLGTGQGVTSEK